MDSTLPNVITRAKFHSQTFNGYYFTEGGRISHFPIDFYMDISTCSATAQPVIIYLPVLDESRHLLSNQQTFCHYTKLLFPNKFSFFYSYTQEYSFIIR